jgi:predicted ATPase/DNA-binding XRE family transcriptional regulator
MNDQSFGPWLRRKRMALGLTQAALASQVFCSAATIRKLEAEERRPSEQIVGRLADIFKIPETGQIEFLNFARGNLDSAPGGIIEDVPWQVPITIPYANIPIPISSFIGREKNVKDIIQLLGKDRLITLTGPGGVGKTRLAIQSSNELLDKFGNGVCWVELAGLTDEGLVPQALAKSLRVREIPNESLNETLANYLSSKQILLVLDNCEHLIEGCAQLANKLLSACPALKILATSREALGLTGEVVVPIPILSLPNTRALSLVELLLQYEGIHLFVERASDANPDFRLTEQNALSVAQICQQLDGMPLAIELAAARVRMMSVSEIGQRLDDRLNFLSLGSRGGVPRHQTLRAAIDWSYELLSAPERTLYCRLSVFAGGFTLEMAEEVAVGGDVSRSQIIELLGQLIDKSLVSVKPRLEDSVIGTRYGMLETIREYALEKLAESGEAEHVHQHHCAFFVVLAQKAEPNLKGAQQLEWLDHLDVEHDNFRAALNWTEEVGAAETTLLLAGMLFWFWKRRSYLAEGRAWLERTLAVAIAVTTSTRAKALYAAAYLARAQGDFTRSREFVEQCIPLWQTLGIAGKQGLGDSLALLGGLDRDQGEPTKARSLIEESVAIFREQGDLWGLASSLISLGMAIRDLEEYALARSIIEESVALWREQGDLWGLAEALQYLGLVAYRLGDYETAYSLTEETLVIRRRLGDKQAIAYSLHNLGVFTLAQGNPDRARTFFLQDLILFREVGDKSGMVLALQYQGLLAMLQGDAVQAQSILEQGLTLSLETGPRWISSNYLLWLAGIAIDRGQIGRATRLCSAAKAQLAVSTSYWDAFERRYYEHVVAHARASLGEDAFALAQEEGKTMSVEQAIAYALENEDS